MVRGKCKTNLHNVISAMKAKEVLYAEEFIGFIEESDSFHGQWFERFVNETLIIMSDAVCFDMGNIDEMIESPEQYRTFRLPFPICWFEIVLSNGDIRGYLAREFSGEGNWDSYFLQFERCKGETAWRCTAHFGTREDGTGVVKIKKETCGFEQTGQGRAVRNLLHIFLGLLNTPGLQPVEVKPSLKLQRKREKRGKPPIFSTWTLGVELPKKNNKQNSGMGGTTGKKLRLHLNRGHMRRVNRQGDVRYIDPYLAGDKGLGVIQKDYSAKYKKS